MLLLLLRLSRSGGKVAVDVALRGLLLAIRKWI